MIGEKQKKILAFPYTHYDALICDGSIRSGKTSLMTVAFVDWAMESYSGKRFIILGKTVGSAIRNVVEPYLMMAYPASKGYRVNFNRSNNRMTVTKGGKSNQFDIFGANDESAYMKIQGFTAAGCLVDEVALCVCSAVNQALARCSVDGSKLWFNCNPESPEHWFYREWIQQAAQKKALYLHFVLDDNPSLPEHIKDRYKAMYSGVFEDRYIKGLWTRAEGLIYPDYKDALEPPYQGEVKRWVVSCDYGTQNAFAALKWALGVDGVWHCVEEYRYSGRETGIQKTDAEYVTDMLEFCKGIEGCLFIVDPSAASFIAAMRKTGKFSVRKAVNNVADGIRDTATAMKTGLVRIGENCEGLVTEFAGYVWDDKRGGDVPLKVADHCCVTPDTMVETMEGQKPIRDLVGKSGRVWSYDGERPVLRKYDNVRATGFKDVFRLRLEDGRFVDCTSDHPILTEEGWKRLDQLKRGDKVVCI